MGVVVSIIDPNDVLLISQEEQRRKDETMTIKYVGEEKCPLADLAQQTNISELDLNVHYKNRVDNNAYDAAHYVVGYVEDNYFPARRGISLAAHLLIEMEESDVEYRVADNFTLSDYYPGKFGLTVYSNVAGKENTAHTIYRNKGKYEFVVLTYNDFKNKGFSGSTSNGLFGSYDKMDVFDGFEYETEVYDAINKFLAIVNGNEEE